MLPSWHSGHLPSGEEHRALKTTAHFQDTSLAGTPVSASVSLVQVLRVLKNAVGGVGEMVQQLGTPGGPAFNSQHPHSGSQLL